MLWQYGIDPILDIAVADMGTTKHDFEQLLLAYALCIVVILQQSKIQINSNQIHESNNLMKYDCQKGKQKIQQLGTYHGFGKKYVKNESSKDTTNDKIM